MKTKDELREEMLYAGAQIPNVEPMLDDLALRDLSRALEIMDAIRPDVDTTTIVEAMTDDHVRPLGIYLVSSDHKNDEIRKQRLLIGLVYLVSVDDGVCIANLTVSPLSTKCELSLLRWILRAVIKDVQRGADKDMMLSIRTGDASLQTLALAAYGECFRCTKTVRRLTGEHVEILGRICPVEELIDCWELPITANKPAECDDEEECGACCDEPQCACRE